MLAFATAWKDSFHEGVCDHNIKELCRIYVSRSVKCEYCGNQRSEKSRNAGLVEDDYRELLEFDVITSYSIHYTKLYDHRRDHAGGDPLAPRIVGIVVCFSIPHDVDRHPDPRRLR